MAAHQRRQPVTASIIYPALAYLTVSTHNQTFTDSAFPSSKHTKQEARISPLLPTTIPPATPNQRQQHTRPAALPANITMAPRRRKANIEEAPIQPAPAPSSYLSLPDVAHGIIASFLPDSNKGAESRLRVAEASRALFESYGGTLANLRIKYSK